MFQQILHDCGRCKDFIWEIHKRAEASIGVTLYLHAFLVG